TASTLEALRTAGADPALAAAWRLQQALGQVLQCAIGEGADPEQEPSGFQARLAAAGGAADFASLKQELEAVRARAHAAFAALVEQADRAPRAERGPVSQAEFVDRQVQRLRTMDADNDGVVTAAERTAARGAARAEHADRRFTRLDANGDGMISRAEFDAA